MYERDRISDGRCDHTLVRSRRPLPGYPAAFPSSGLIMLSTDLYSPHRVSGDPDEEYIVLYSLISHYYPLINYVQLVRHIWMMVFSD